MIKILPETFFLAPMAELTTPALRSTVKEFTSNVVLYSEMLSAGALVSGAEFNEHLLARYPFDDPYIYQILGNSPDIMSDACRILSDKGCFSIDINMGCSAPNIVKKGFGAKLLTDIDNTKKIIKSCRKVSKSFLSVKMRSGFTESNIDYLINFIKMLEGEGVDFISLHPRFAKLAYKRTANWNLIKIVKKNIKIPLIGNGDITSPMDGIKKMQESNCDGIMIGRESIKSPWIFQLCNDLINKKNNVLEINIYDIFIKTLKKINFYLPEHLHKSRGHRFSFYFSNNAYFAHALFNKIRQADTIDHMCEIVDDYYIRNANEQIKTYKIINGIVHEVDKI